jgi:O-acetyl-ADP-ribose deacetylase (regulator of RNase III)
VVTSAGRLPARWIIHAVGPVWRGGTHGEAGLLTSAYRASLDHAARLGAARVAFPAISCGVYGYPLDEAADVALGAVRGWLADHPDGGVAEIDFVLRGEAVMAAFTSALERIGA